MNRTEVIALLKKRSGALSQPYGPEAEDVWYDVLKRYSFEDAYVALLKAVAKTTNDRVSVKAVLDELSDHKPTRSHTESLGADGCRECDGSGFSAVAHDPRDPPGTVRYGPCRTCRREGAVRAVPNGPADSARDVRDGRLPPERIAQLVAEGIAEGRAERLRHATRLQADPDPAVQATGARIRSWLDEHPPRELPGTVRDVQQITGLIAHDASEAATDDDARRLRAVGDAIAIAADDPYADEPF